MKNLTFVAMAMIMAHVVHGNPDKVTTVSGCPRAITKGNTIMGSGVVESTSDYVKLHDHNTMKSFDCGSTVACNAKLAFEMSTGPTTSLAQYVIETVATAGTNSSWVIKGGKCDGARVLFSSGDPMSTTYTVPASGSVTVRVAWAKANGQVRVSPDCTYTVTGTCKVPVQAPSSTPSPRASHAAARSGGVVGYMCMALAVAALAYASNSV